jgi:hypothetical protein
MIGFLVEPQNQGGGGFPGLGLKTGSFGLVIWASKSSRWFLGLGLKIKWASVCWLRHKTDGGRSTRDTRQDLAACFAWRLRRRQVEDGQVNMMGCVRLYYPTFVVFNVLGTRGIVVI